jgi:hypothetical protein
VCAESALKLFADRLASKYKMPGAKLFLLCVVCVNIFAQPAGRGVISGTVIDAATGDPVRKAIVKVMARNASLLGHDAHGRFGKVQFRRTARG